MASSRGSVAIRPEFCCRASIWASTTVCRASAVKRSNMSVLPPERPAAARVLLVHGLPAHAEQLGDLLPRPALLAGVGDLERLETLDEGSQGPDGTEADRRVLAAGSGCHLRRVRHGCQLRLPHAACQSKLTMNREL